jgi:hypothetical protein
MTAGPSRCQLYVLREEAVLKTSSVLDRPSGPSSLAFVLNGETRAWRNAIINAETI